MEELTALALVGTARAGGQSVTTGTPADALVAALGDMSPEQRVLLLAGMQTIAAQAGYLPPIAPHTPDPAQPEPRPYCSPGIAAMLFQLCSSPAQSEILREALARLQGAGLLLTPDLLPRALATTTADLRPLLSAVLGERGRWLATFNPAWAWAVAEPITGAGLPPEAETIWQEGHLLQRIEILRRLRLADPDLARQWVADGWKQEKAEARRQMLYCFATHLSTADEPFLTQVLDDRSTTVRDIAVQHLRCIPQSALAQRLLVRADAMLRIDNGVLLVNPPRSIDQDTQWESDGLRAKPPSGVGKRAWWLSEVLAAVPPDHWEAQLGGNPAALVTLATGCDEELALIEGWSRAAITFGGEGWYAPLWQWWLLPNHDNTLSEVYYAALRGELLHRLPSDEAERLVLDLLAVGTPPKDGWDDILVGLPRPWSPTFGNTYLRTIREHLASLTVTSTDDSTWHATLANAALALPPACFPTALEPLEVPELQRSWQYHQWRSQLAQFEDTVRLRQIIYKEIPDDQR